jgi:hypothetical protein
MSRLIAVHQLTLKEGVTPEQFESFVRNEYKTLDIPGWRFSIAKGDRGKSAGTFVEIFESDVASRDRDYPSPTGLPSEESKAAWKRALDTPEQKRVEERWEALVARPTVPRNYTDYVVIAE